jgi:hypothetical protein
MHDSTEESVYKTLSSSDYVILGKLVKEVVTLYGDDPQWVKNDILNLRTNIKLNKKLRETVPDPKVRAKIYKGIDFYRLLRKQGKGHEKACKIVEVHFDLPEGEMKSIIAARNGFKSAKF